MGLIVIETPGYTSFQWRSILLWTDHPRFQKNKNNKFFFLAFIGNIMMIHLSLTGPKTPLKQTSEMWGKQLHRA